MEVKINREIRNYTESMFFGLSLRQFVFSLLAVGVAVLLYFVLKPYVGTETVSWMCILVLRPCGKGFVNYNGMTAEQFVWAWLRSEMLEPKQIKFEPVNIYYEALKDAYREREKEVSSTMIKSIKAILAQDKEKFKVPRKVQNLIPIKNIWPDGIFKVGNKFSKSFRFSDINYLVASREDKESMFLTYSELLNSLDSGATTKITINNHRLNRSGILRNPS